MKEIKVSLKSCCLLVDGSKSQPLTVDSWRVSELVSAHWCVGLDPRVAGGETQVVQESSCSPAGRQGWDMRGPRSDAILLLC